MTRPPHERVLGALAVPGVRWLSVADLAVRTGLARGVVQLALQQLQEIGLVTGPPHQPGLEWSITTTGQAVLEVQARTWARWAA